MGIFSWLLEGNERTNSHVEHLNKSCIVSNTGYSYLLTYLLTYVLTPPDIRIDIPADTPTDILADTLTDILADTLTDIPTETC